MHQRSSKIYIIIINYTYIVIPNATTLIKTPEISLLDGIEELDALFRMGHGLGEAAGARIEMAQPRAEVQNIQETQKQKCKLM